MNAYKMCLQELAERATASTAIGRQRLSSKVMTGTCFVVLGCAIIPVQPLGGTGGGKGGITGLD